MLIRMNEWSLQRKTVIKAMHEHVSRSTMQVLPDDLEESLKGALKSGKLLDLC